MCIKIGFFLPFSRSSGLQKINCRRMQRRQLQKKNPLCLEANPIMKVDGFPKLRERLVSQRSCLFPSSNIYILWEPSLVDSKLESQEKVCNKKWFNSGDRSPSLFFFSFVQNGVNRSLSSFVGDCEVRRGGLPLPYKVYCISTTW